MEQRQRRNGWQDPAASRKLTTPSRFVDEAKDKQERGIFGAAIDTDLEATLSQRKSGLARSNELLSGIVYGPHSAPDSNDLALAVTPRRRCRETPKSGTRRRRGPNREQVCSATAETTLVPPQCTDKCTMREEGTPLTVQVTTGTEVSAQVRTPATRTVLFPLKSKLRA
ncbi:hypothetical protein HPB48_010893 [Haemaphysalis longicornis]|uniref:Uncharacterized protein n=1 Tax=Haemaphysalis longicornis TaxID=44386 RepID=A0A9J6G9P9_HAELO|nr:hypothetical protein HPB48_010893 [Haemaphysalis longicornis]